MSWTTLSAAAAVVEREERLLMVRQRRPTGVWWELPGGYRERDESFEETAAREVLEETGVQIEVGDLLCTLVWEREHDRRRNVLLYFLASPLDADPAPRPQLEEDIEEAAFVDPIGLGDEVHPLERPVVERWRGTGEKGFHLHADVHVAADGSQTYVLR